MDSSIGDWIRAWFERRNPGTKISDKLNFYQEGYVDSFGIIELIEAIEDHFSIRFEDGDFKMPSFRTITGVSALVEQRKERRG